MRFSRALAVTVSLASLAAACSPQAPSTDTNTDITETETMPLTPPIADRRPVTIEQVGRTRTDPYAWLKDENWQDVMRDPSLLDADIRAYLEAENAYTKAILEDTTEDLREELFHHSRAPLERKLPRLRRVADVGGVQSHQEQQTDVLPLEVLAEAVAGELRLELGQVLEVRLHVGA